ncbi:MAG: hypothetical protein KC729_10045, partial [Candidatus Eisenbacteria bacterium]|nr:hypothetical protein [Candidatus Eisenbacteria bacterium]
MKHRMAITALCVVGAVALPLRTRAVTVPADGQSQYEVALPAFDLTSARSASADVDRLQAESSLTDLYGGSWSVYTWNPQSGTPSEMYGSGVDLALALTSQDDVRALAESVIQESEPTLRANPDELRFDVVTSSPPRTNTPDGIDRPGKWAAHFRQTYHGLDVVGGEVHLTFTDRGRLFALGSTYYRDIDLDWTPTLSAEDAKDIARDGLPYDPTTDSVDDEATLEILPIPTGVSSVEHHLVWTVRVRTLEPRGVWDTRVDAHDGRVLERTNDIAFLNYIGSVSGSVERLSYCDGTIQESYPYARVSILNVGSAYSDANGVWSVPYAGTDPGTLYARLLSPYVDVQNSQGPWAGQFATVFPLVPYQVVFHDGNSRADERDVFKTVQDLHNFIETFAPGFGFSNQVVTAHVNINNTCNAYYSGNTINFYMAGGGCGNTGQIMDIVAHEYGHGVQEAILGWQGNEGLGEGNGDVLAFLTSMSSVIGRGFYNCTASGGLRDCNNDLVYPDNVVGQEIHDAGRVIAGFHWDAMQDQIADYGSWGRYSTAWDWHWGRVLQLPTSQPAQVLATFIANDDDGNLVNGTPQFNSYCLGATHHGFTCPSANLPLGAGACDTYYQSPQGYTMNQQNVYWTAVAVSPEPGDDKDMRVYTQGYGNLLAASLGTVGTDFVVGDFNHNATGTYQPYVSFGGTTKPFVTEWDSGADAITLGTDISGSMGGASGGCGLIRIWDVFLTAGQTYTFGLLNNGGDADMRLSLFRNPAAAPYWVGRNQSVFELPAGQSLLYTAPATDWYGVVVFNNTQGPSYGYYTLRVQNAPSPLQSAVCQAQTVSPRITSFTQNPIYWAGVAVNPSGGDDKDIAVYADPGAAGPALGSSTRVTGTDFVVGDFNHTTPGTYYSRVSYGSPTASYVTEFEGGADVIYPDTQVSGSVGGGSGGCGLIQVWDLYLDEGQQARFLLLTGGSNIRMALFRNPADAPYWAGRSWAEFEVGDQQGYTYTAPTGDWYGVVVFNDAPGSTGGSYTLRVSNLPAALADAQCVSDTAVPKLYAFTQTNPYWSAVAVNPTGSDDKDVWVFDNPDGLGTPVGASTGTVGTDFVIGDFNHNAAGTYYAYATYGPPANYLLQWDDGPDIFPLGTDVAGTVGGGGDGCGVIQVWDVYLEEGQPYQFTFGSGGGADVRASLFRNPTSGTYWAGRYDAQFELTPSPSAFEYTAPASDYYGVVV